jgi:DNA mismatch repair ATPase MutS
MLVQDMNRYVAISEEFANDPSNRVKSGLQFDRRVTRIITPGTLIDEKFVDPWENNFLLSIHLEELQSPPDPELSQTKQLGLAWLDLSSGDFFTQNIDLEALPSAIARISPREIVIDKSFEGEKAGILSSVLSEGQYVVTYHQIKSTDSSSPWMDQFEDDAAAEQDKFTGLEVGAGNVLLHYVETQLQGRLPKLRSPIQRQNEEYMAIDRNSLKALEIRETLRDGLFEGSLLHAIRRTVTKSGSRLLSRRISKKLARFLLLYTYAIYSIAIGFSGRD